MQLGGHGTSGVKSFISGLVYLILGFAVLRIETQIHGGP